MPVSLYSPLLLGPPRGRARSPMPSLSPARPAGPADVTYTAWYLFARGVGLIAMVNLEDVSAFWVFHVDTAAGKVLAVK
jgi:hypothetical protein